MRKACLLRDKEGNYLTTTKNIDEAFRFESPVVYWELSQILNMEVVEIEEDDCVKENATVQNDW